MNIRCRRRGSERAVIPTREYLDDGKINDGKTRWCASLFYLVTVRVCGGAGREREPRMPGLFRLPLNRRHRQSRFTPAAIGKSGLRNGWRSSNARSGPERPGTTRSDLELHGMRRDRFPMYFRVLFMCHGVITKAQTVCKELVQKCTQALAHFSFTYTGNNKLMWTI